MNLLGKLFGNKTKTESNPIVNIAETLASDGSSDIFKNLFVENNPPQAIEEATEKTENLLKIFLENNYQNKGYNDGYEFHTTETLDNFKKRIRVEFRYLIEQIIDDKRSEICKLRDNIINTEGLSERISKQLDNRIAEFESVIIKLEKEKELSSMDEGLIMLPVHNYQDGFVKGTEQYLLEKNLASSTGMFV